MLMVLLIKLMLLATAGFTLFTTTLAASWTYATGHWDDRASQGTTILITMGLALLFFATTIS